MQILNFRVKTIYEVKGVGSSYSGCLYSHCLVKAHLECNMHHHYSLLKCLFQSKKGGPELHLLPPKVTLELSKLRAEADCQF